MSTWFWNSFGSTCLAIYEEEVFPGKFDLLHCSGCLMFTSEKSSDIVNYAFNKSSDAVIPATFGEEMMRCGWGWKTK